MIAIIFILLIFYQNVIEPRYHQEELDKKNAYHKIKNIIKKGSFRKDIYDILNKKKIKYHNDKNQNIDITGEGITIEINDKNQTVKFIPY